MMYARVRALCVLAVCAASASAATTLGPAGNQYTASEDVSNELQYSAKMGELHTALSANSWDAAKEQYLTYFKTWAVGVSSLSGDDASKVKAYFVGDKKNAADYIQMSLDGTAPYTAGTADAARQEAVQKTLWDDVAVRYILSHASQGHWDKAAALYLGNMKNSPYGRAQKRGSNYGTMTNGVANANIDAIKALNAKDYAGLLKSIHTTYAQATLRYMHKLDSDKKAGMGEGTTAGSPWDHEGEGYAFARVVAPYVSAKDAGGMDAILAEYTPGGSIGDRLYCKTLRVLQGAIPDVTATSNFGTLDDTEDTKCWEVASFFAPVYTSSSDVSNELQYSAKMGELHTALSANSWDAAKEQYLTYFKTWAVGVSSLSGDDASKVKAYFVGDKKNAADYIQMSLDGTAPYTAGTADAARQEAVQKTLWDDVAVRYILSHASQGHWDKAAALYLGNMKNSPYGRAQKRGSNYGTMTNGVANANIDAIKALNAKDYAGLLKSIHTTYAQATLRYMHKLDSDKKAGMGEGTTAGSPWDHEGEGYAFARVVAPYVSAKDAGGMDAILAEYTPGGSIGDRLYCKTLRVLQGAIPDVTATSNFGTLEKTNPADCKDTDAFKGSKVADSSSSAASLGCMGVLGATMLLTAAAH